MIFYSKTFSELTNSELYGILKARFQIFVLEQNINRQDMDEIDKEALHCFIKENDEVIACIRAHYVDKARKEVKISRVLTLVHGGGVGRRLMEEALIAIKQKMPHNRLFVYAQKQAVGYYKKMGFCAVSEEFTDAGIPHIEMEFIAQ